MVTLPKRLSPSAINTHIQCPQKYKFSYLDGKWGEPNHHMVRGNFVHRILETLFDKPATERVLDEAKTIAKALWNVEWKRKAQEVVDGDYDLRQFQWDSWWAVVNYFSLEDPALIEPGGRETSVMGPVSGVTVKGFIDRWDRAEGGIEIVDYKTGKTPRKREYAAGYALQLDLYAVLLEAKTHETVSKLRLLYLKDGDVLEFEATDTRRQSTLTTVANVWSAISESCQTGEFETKTSRLCDWCDHKAYCPAWAL